MFASRIFTGHEWLENKEISVTNGRISAISDGHGLASENFFVPGFIDLQIYGGGGILFSNHQTTESIQATFDEHHKTGTVAFQITLNCSPAQTMWKAIDAYKNYTGPGLVGLHLEGPFFNPVRRGAHNEEFVQKPSIDFLAELIERTKGIPTYLTIAPEMFSAEELSLLMDSRIMCSLGHSDATFEQAIEAVNNGVSRITHLFNAMSQWQSRALGLVGASFQSEAWTSIIADGLHCDYKSLEIAYRLKKGRLFLITDAVTNDTSGPYSFLSQNGRFTNEAGVLSGSSLTMIEAIQNCVRQASIPLEEAIRMATVYPAEVAKLTDLGSIEVGKRACLVELNPSLEVVQVWYDGKALLN
ncbi:MAG: N-acetylglucosamine-6-phosphate deacetylase [Bacteroidota bacterium]|jgi:N-acetylglucosamine-6-phosphate deacetylase